MGQSFDLLPSGDGDNDGWTLVGAFADYIWEALSFDGDDCYVHNPAYRGGVEVKFPIDTTALPAGAIVDSVTVFIRLQTNSGSGTRTVTVNVLSSDNRSRYTTRTIRATGTWTTFEVGTYTRDPLGRPWDIHRLNKLRLRIFSYNRIENSVQCSMLYARVNYHTRPTASVTSPTGTVNTPSPTIAWQYRQEEGEPQKEARYALFTADQAAAADFDPEVAAPVYYVELVGEASEYVLPTSLNPDDYRLYVQVMSQFGAISDWAWKAFSVQGPAPGVPGDNNAGISGTPGIGVPSIVADSYTSSAVLTMQDSSNLLSVQQADFEIATDPLEYLGTNCTPARDTGASFPPGVASMKLAATTAATMAAKSTLIEIADEQPVTVRAQVKAAATGRTVNLKCEFYDADFALLSTLTQAGTDATGTWTEIVATGTTPSGTAYASVVVEVVSPASAEAHYVDHVGLMYGTNTAWSDGGHTSRNLLSSHLATGDDPGLAGDAWEAANVATTVATVATSGTGAHGAKTNQLTYGSVSSSIAYRATGTVFTTPTTGKDYTLNKPATVANGDLMVAFVTSTEHGTITPPPGWKAVNTASVDDDSTDVALWVLKRTVSASDPATWAGEVSVDSSRRTAVVVAYSGAATADQQFIAENVRTDATGALKHTTATVANTDPNAWRISAFAASDDVSGGTMVANRLPPPGSPIISFVGQATPWSSLSDAATYQLNRPPNVQQGDLMLATVALSGNVATVTPPSGWTLVRRIFKANSTTNGDAHSGDITVGVLKRTAGASEPTSWSGTYTSGAGFPKLTQVLAYRNADLDTAQFIDDDESARVGGYSLNTATVTNTNSLAWRVTMMSATTPNGDSGWTSDNKLRASDTTRFKDFPDVLTTIWDSNGPVSTGNHSRNTQIYGYDAFTMVSWIALLKPATVGPAQGANESERVDNANGSSNPWLSTAVYDSGGVAEVGEQSVTGVLTPGSGTSGANSMASWIGVIRPNTNVEAGKVAAYPSASIEISAIDPKVLQLAQNKLTFMASYLGSTAGTAVLIVEFFRANQLIATRTAVGGSFNSSVWTKAHAQFNIPEGTTRIRPQVAATGRAVGDTVKFDRVSLALGGYEADRVPMWRNGTSRAAHTVWAQPVIEYADDDGTGYGPWTPLSGQIAYPVVFDAHDGTLRYADHTIVPLNSRRYRVRTLAYGLAGDAFASVVGPASDEATFSAVNWWLKDIRDPGSNMLLTVSAAPIQVGTTNTAVAFQTLGADYPVVVSEGYKADTIPLTLQVRRNEYTALKAMLAKGRTLLLQSDYDHSWWVRAVGDLDAETLPTGQRTRKPLRFVKVTFVQVAPEE